MPKYIPPTSNTKPLPIGLSLPIQRGKAGYFDLNYDTTSQIKANIINLLNTKRGERTLQPLFGSGLQEALMNQITDNTSGVLTQIIIDDITNWIPNVVVTNVNVTLPGYSTNQLTDINNVYLSITFTINNIQDSVDLVIQQNNI
jgi:phage baseplate assembly protein W